MSYDMLDFMSIICVSCMLSTVTFNLVSELDLGTGSIAVLLYLYLECFLFFFFFWALWINGIFNDRMYIMPFQVKFPSSRNWRTFDWKSVLCSFDVSNGL